MGTGNITLYWYAMCCAFSAFVFIVAGALIGYGRFKERKRRAAKSIRNHSENGPGDRSP